MEYYDKNGVYVGDEVLDLSDTDFIRANIVNILTDNDDLNVAYTIKELMEACDRIDRRLRDMDDKYESERRAHFETKRDFLKYRHEHPEA